MTIDTSFADAAIILPREFQRLKIYLIGAGGTGSYAAMSIARLCFELERTGKLSELTIIDPDRVEAGNIPRSNFCAAEIGRFKAQTLAERITQAWGLEVSYINEELSCEKHIEHANYRELTVLVGCVDNHHARIEIDRTLRKLNEHNMRQAPKAWWIDGGNGRSSGQVLIGSSFKKFSKKNLFTSKTICQKLPAPSVIHPELLEDQEIASSHSETQRLTCPERIRLGDQSLNINSRVAVEIAQMLTELFLTNSLKRFATYFDLESGTSRSLYCTPENIKQALPKNKRKARKIKT